MKIFPVTTRPRQTRDGATTHATREICISHGPDLSTESVRVCVSFHRVSLYVLAAVTRCEGYLNAQNPDERKRKKYGVPDS